MNNEIESNRILYASILFCLFFLVQSCAANLPAVREFSKATVLTSEPFNQVLQDLPKSCARRVAVKILNKYEITEGSYSVKLTDEYKDDLALCTGYEEATKKIVLAHDVLQNYAEALGKLASDDVVTFNKETSDLKSSLQNFKLKGTSIFQEPEAKATSVIADFLFNLAVQGYRQKKLNETIQMAGEPIDQDPQTYCQNSSHNETSSNLDLLINGLRNFASFYKNELRSEKNSSIALRDNFIDDYRDLSEILESHQKENGTLTLLLEENRENTKERIIELEAHALLTESRLSAADAYTKILGEISSTHKKLYCRSLMNELDSPEMINEIKNYVKHLFPLFTLIRQSFSQ